MIRSFCASALIAGSLLTSAARAQDHRYEALGLADDIHEILTNLAEDAQFLARGASEIGDSSGWLRYTDVSAKMGSVAFDFSGYSQSLSNEMLPMYMVDQDYAFKAQNIRALGLAFSRLRFPPQYFIERYQEFVGLDLRFRAAIATAPADPNSEPDQPGHWRCSAVWSMNGTRVGFNADGNSRNRAKAAALSECNQRFTRFCQIEGCQLVSSPNRSRR